ncbi:MAG: hypothetical protein JRI68_31990 [Deltaproteobacteria bacterium]|nr:hypothetical protein [Deltaproteobacteria bacterium]
MVLICLLAVTATGVTGLFAIMFQSRLATAQQREQRLDEQVRNEMFALGWQPPESDSLRALSEQLRTRRGVEILHARTPFAVGLAHGPVAGHAADEGPLAAATVVLVDELSLLPRSFLERAGLRRVMLCAELREARRPIPSLPNYRNTLLLDAEASPSYLRRLIHHEVFHFADLADDGVVLADPGYRALTPPGFEYGSGGRTMRERSSSAFGEAPAGFVSRYATSAIEEDKAEVFAFLMTRPAAMDQLGRRDPVVAAKAAYVRMVVALLSDELDEAFWRAVARAPGR